MYLLKKALSYETEGESVVILKICLNYERLVKFPKIISIKAEKCDWIVLLLGHITIRLDLIEYVARIDISAISFSTWFTSLWHTLIKCNK